MKMSMEVYYKGMEKIEENRLGNGFVLAPKVVEYLHRVIQSYL